MAFKYGSKRKFIIRFSDASTEAVGESKPKKSTKLKEFEKSKTVSGAENLYVQTILRVDGSFENYNTEHHQRIITAAAKILHCCERHL